MKIFIGFVIGLGVGWFTLGIALIIRDDLYRWRREFPSLSEYRRLRNEGEVPRRAK